MIGEEFAACRAEVDLALVDAVAQAQATVLARREGEGRAEPVILGIEGAVLRLGLFIVQIHAERHVTRKERRFGEGER
jgi:hypothetical protein